MSNIQRRPEYSSKTVPRDGFAETAVEEGMDEGSRKLTVNEALELLDKMSFSTDSDSTEMIRELRDAR